MDNGEPIYTQEYIQSLRDADKKHPDKLKIIAQRGGQERMLSIDADIKIVGGSRGGPLDEDTRVLTTRGFIKIKNLKYGCTVIGHDGKGHRVLGRIDYPDRDCYEIELSDPYRRPLWSLDQPSRTRIFQRSGQEQRRGCRGICHRISTDHVPARTDRPDDDSVPLLAGRHRGG